LHDDRGAKLLRLGAERVAVALPAFLLERVERKADDGFFPRGEGGRGGGEKQQNEKQAEFMTG